MRPRAFLWWLVDELTKTGRDEPSLEEWLRVQEWKILLAHGEKEQLGQMVGNCVGLIANEISLVGLFEASMTRLTLLD